VLLAGGSLLDRLLHHGWDVTELGCWEWKGTRDKAGYGRFKYHQKTVSAHRSAYTVWIGPIPDTLLVRHTCDNPPCINPKHFVLGTDKDNAKDREERNPGRQSKGENNGSSILTSDQVLEIRRTYPQRTISRKQFAALYGVGEGTIKAIMRGKTWRHLL
jgi:hypothetical protein